MFHLEDVLQLKEGEKVTSMIRRHVMTLLPNLAFAVLLIVLPFFLLFPLFSWGIPGVILFAVAVIGGIVIAIRTMVLWDADVLVITNLRLVDVDQKGLFTRAVTEAQLLNIQEVSWKKNGMFETLFGMGSIIVQTAGTANNVEAVRVPHPQRIADFINNMRHQTAPKKTAIDPEKYEKLKLIQNLLQGFSLEELERIETILRARERQAASDAFLGEDGKQEA